MRYESNLFASRGSFYRHGARWTRKKHQNRNRHDLRRKSHPPSINPPVRKKTQNWWPFKRKKSFLTVEFLSGSSKALRLRSSIFLERFFIEDAKWKMVRTAPTERGKIILYFAFEREELTKPWKINFPDSTDNVWAKSSSPKIRCGLYQRLW